jgi:hypothetical protein
MIIVSGILGMLVDIAAALLPRPPDFLTGRSCK